MTIKIYISRECGNTKLKRDQAYILRTLYIKKIEVEEIDLSDPHREKEKLFMQDKLKVEDVDLKILPPQIFNDEEPIGVFEQFFDSVEADQLYSFLHLDIPETEVEYLAKHSAEPAVEKKEDVEVGADTTDAPTEEEKTDDAPEENVPTVKQELEEVSTQLDTVASELTEVKQELDEAKVEVEQERQKADDLQERLDEVEGSTDEVEKDEENNDKPSGEAPSIDVTEEESEQL